MVTTVMEMMEGRKGVVTETVQLSHPYMTTGKTITLTRRTFVGNPQGQCLGQPVARGIHWGATHQKFSGTAPGTPPVSGKLGCAGGGAMRRRHG